MLGILSAPKQVIKANLKLLAKDYKEKTGRVVCLSCPSDIAYMISSLKQIYKMTNFEFKRNAAQYKNKKGDKTTISNSTMTDEKAIEFLRTNPERIGLFSKFPENWEALIQEAPLSQDEIELKAIEQAAELEAAEALKAINEAGKGEDLTKGGLVGQTDLIKAIDEEMIAATEGLKNIEVDSEEVLSPEEEALKASEQAAEEAANSALNEEAAKEEDCCDEEHEGEPCEECKEKKRQELSKMTLKDLRAAYPEIKATSIATFVEKVINQ